MIINDKYEIISKVGDGRFSTCWEALNKENNEIVVIKIQKKIDEKHTEQMKKEIGFYKTLENGCENIVKMLDNFIYKGDNSIETYCIVFEKMDKTLFDLLEESETGLQLNLVKDLTKQLVNGLSYLHSKGIIHTDLKPENILIKLLENDDSENSKYKLVITDLGNATSNELDSFTESTLEYNSPEFILDSEFNDKVDIWSLGCIVFEMLTNNYLFDVRSYLNSIYNIDSDSDSESSCSDSSSSTSSEDTYLENNMYLNLCQRTLGEIPLYTVRNSNNFDMYFNKNGSFKSFIKIAKQKSILNTLTFDYNFDRNVAEEVEEFIKPMLNFDIKKRCSSQDLLNSEFYLKETSE